MGTTYRADRRFTTLLARCRQLRQECTDAERLLWGLLRGRQVDGAKFRRQHQYGPCILDFYCAEHRLAIEVDGGQHFSEAGSAEDAARTRYLGDRGIRVLRFDNRQVLQETEGVVEAIWQALAGSSPAAAPRRKPSP